MDYVSKTVGQPSVRFGMNYLSTRRYLYFYMIVGLFMMVNLCVYRRGHWKLHYRQYNNRLLPSRKSYILSLILPEQLTMCTIHFHQLQNLINDWNFTGVEPFAYGSTMFGLRSLNPKDPYGSLPFNKLFNATMHNQYLSECMKRPPDPETGFPVLFEPISEFLRRSYGKLVLVYFGGHVHSEYVLTKSVYSKMENALRKESNPYTDCSLAAKKFGVFSQVESLLSKEMELEKYYPTVPMSTKVTVGDNYKRFEVVQAFCVNQKVKLSLSEFRDYVFDHMNGLGKVSIVFISWQGRFTHSMIDYDAKTFINKCRLPFSNPFHSDYIKSLAQKYVQSELKFKEQPYLSIHIRFEKLLIYILKKNHQLMDAYLDCCMRRLNSIVHIVTEKFNISERNVLMNWDYSPYGSATNPMSRTKETVNKYLKMLNVKPSYFEPKKFNLPSHRGLISLVEMHALYRGKALVTVGEGSYQLTIVRTFIDHHRHSENPKLADKLHYGHLCIPPEQLHEVSETLEPKCSY